MAGAQLGDFVGSDAWGAAKRMNGLDAAMWRAEADPLLRSTLMGVYLLDRAPDWDKVLAEHERYARLVPRLGQRVADVPFGVGLPSWRHDAELDLDYHVRRVRLPAPGDHRALLDLAQTVARTPFDRRRPLWESVLVEGLNGDQAGYLLKLHHSCMDGVAFMQMDALLHPPCGREHPGLSLVPTEHDETTRVRSPAESVQTLVASAEWLARGTVGALRSPRRVLRESSRMAESAVRVLARPAAAPSSLLRGRGGNWRFLTAEVPLEELRAAARVAQASLNDAVVAAVLGGLRRYHEQFGELPSKLAAAIPIAGGGPGQVRGGNGFSVARMAMPMDEPDPVRRMRMVRELIGGVRAEPAGKVPVLIAHVMGHLPSCVVAPVFKHTTRAHDVQISNLRGAEKPLSLAGARILRLYPFGSLPATALSVTMHSYAGVCCFGLNFDAAAIDDPELLARCFQEGIDETVASA